MFNFICPICLKPFHYHGRKRKYCSRMCFRKDPILIERGKNAGIKNRGKHRIRKPTIKHPGYTFNHDGYKLLFKKGHPTASKWGYIMEHRWIMEKYLKRLLKSDEKIHHKDGNRLNNTIKNLQLYSSHSEHIKNHHRDSNTGQFKKLK